jgi:hypothetical protein
MTQDASAMTPARWLLVVLALWAVMMIVPDLYRVVRPLASFGLIANNDGVVVNVQGPFPAASRSPAASAGIVPGDRIDLRAMRCIPLDAPHCRSLLAVLGGLGGTQIVLPDREIDLVIAPASGGSARLVHMKAARTPHGWIDSLVLLADTLVGVIVILAAFRLVWLRSGMATWGFFLYAIWFNPGQTYAYYALLQQWPIAVFVQELCEALAHGAGFAGLSIFALSFPDDAPSPPWARFSWIAPVLGVVIALLWLASFANAFGVPTESLTSTAFLTGYAVDAAVLLILLQRRRALPAQDQQRMLWVIWGCAIGLSAFIFAEIAQSTSLVQRTLGVTPSSALIGLVYLVNGVLVYFVSVAVLHRRVISVAIPLRYGTILTVLTLAVGIPIVNLHELLAHYQEAFQIPEWIWLFVIAPVALLLLHRLHELGVHLIDRVLNRRFHAIRKSLEDAGMAMLNARTLDEIDRLLVQTPRGALELTSGAVFREQDHVFRREYSIGWEASPLRALLPGEDGAVLRSVDGSSPVRLPLEAWNRSGLNADEQAPSLVVPVKSAALGAVAIVLFGPHENGNDIDPDECEMLGKLAARAASGYERVAFMLLSAEIAELRARFDASKAAPQSRAV